MNAIETSGLSKRYENGVVGLDSLSLSIARGTVFGFLGPNGAGKTTTVRLLNGTLTPTSGEARILGIRSDDEKIRMNTATMSELANMYESLSVLENLRFFAGLYGIEKAAAERRIEELLRAVKLWEKRGLKLGSFSTGMRKRVQLVRTLLHRPELIFFDEPTSGLDPEHSRQVTTLIRRLAREEGTTIFLCTHNLPLAEDICDAFGFISNGSLIMSGTKEELLSQAEDGKRVLVRTDAGEETHEIADESEINGILRRTMDSGRLVFEVTPQRPTLTEVYFKSVGTEKETGGIDELE